VGRAGSLQLALAAIDIAALGSARQGRRPAAVEAAYGATKERLEAYNTDIGWLSIAKEDLVAKSRRPSSMTASGA
jgi:hypothetical protein